jgi:polysaccharide pyruvyl transferase WcaK-like protein
MYFEIRIYLFYFEIRISSFEFIFLLRKKGVCMKILLTEAYTDANVGSAALVENSIELLKPFARSGYIRVLAQNKDAIEKFCGIPTSHEIFILPLGKNRLVQIIWLVSNLSWMAAQWIVRLTRLPIPCRYFTFSVRKKESLRFIRESELCVSVGAERLNDNFFLALPFSLYTLWLIKAYGKKMILFPQTIGPFYFAVSRYFTRRALLRCDYIYARDMKSLDTLKALKIPENKYKFIPDVALLQKTASPGRIREICREQDIPVGRGPLAGVSALKWSYFKSKGKSDYSHYKKVIAGTCDYLIENKDYHIVFVPTNVGIHGCREDDINTGREILELMRNVKRTTLINSLYTPADIKGISGLMDIFIATRMHACILSTGAFTPTVSINYQFKLYEYMKLLGLEHYTVDIEEVSFDKLKKLIDELCLNKENLRSRIKDKIKVLSSYAETALYSDLKAVEMTL